MNSCAIPWPMPASRLTDSQKAELVERFRAGEATQPLAQAFGCSPNTVSRVVKAALDPGEYERLKERRSRRSGGAAQLDVAADSEVAVLAAAPEVEAAEAQPPQSEPSLAPPGGDGSREADGADGQDSDEGDGEDEEEDADGDEEERQQDADVDGEEEENETGPAVLAIDDADDFGDDDDDPLSDVEGEDPSLFVAVAPLHLTGDDLEEIRPLPLESAQLPGSAYLLVDKTVELQPRPLSEFTDLGRLPAEEQDRNALLVFVNPRQAKRLCGRTQRVIKIPDTTVLSRTAPFLLAQGISRVVIEGALFSLPGS